MERKLASIQEVRSIRPIPGADNIEVARINNWDVVTQKGLYEVGDLCIYCEIDSFLPIREEFEFLRKSSYKKMMDVEGFRLRTMRLRGQISQGLLLPLLILESGEEMKLGFSKQPWGDQLQLGPYDDALVIEVGVDVTDVLGIIKYEPPIPAEISGEVKGGFPSFIPKTDEERIQNLTDDFEKWKADGVLFYESEKLDGTSATFYINENLFGICGRNWEFKENDNTFWKVARELNLETNMRSWSKGQYGFLKNHSIQGELIGEGIQGNPYKIKGQTIRFFNLFNIDTFEKEKYDILENYMNISDLQTVPIINKAFKLPDTIDKLLQYVEGKSVLNPLANREGSVFRSLDGSISFKVISNKFLLKKK